MNQVHVPDPPWKRGDQLEEDLNEIDIEEFDPSAYTDGYSARIAYGRYIKRRSTNNGY